MLYYFLIFLGGLSFTLQHNVNLEIKNPQQVEKSILESKELQKIASLQIEKLRKSYESNSNIKKKMKDSDIPAFTADICRTYDPTLGFYSANNVVTKADDILLGNGTEKGLFNHVVRGFSLTIFNSSAAQAFGGGLNPAGAYQVFFFDSNQIFPPGFCNTVPSCTHPNQDFTKPMSCHPRCDPTKSDGDYIFSFTLGEADAIAYTSCSPPPMKFFSLDSCILTRTVKDEEPFYPGQNFGDSLNYRRMNISSPGEKGESNIFEKPYTIIQSGDNNVLEKVKKAYNGAGMPNNAINIMGIDGTTVKFLDRNLGWQNNDAIDLLVDIMRLSEPVDKNWDSPNSTFSKYMSIIWPVSLYFASDDTKATAPFIPQLISRYSNLRDGKPLVNKKLEFESAINYLKSVIKNAYLDYGLNYNGEGKLNGQMPSFYDDWNAVLAKQNNDSFTLPTRDGLYGMLETSLWIQPTTSFAIIGALQPTASYHQVMISSYKVVSMHFSFLLNLSDEDLKGSAQRYLDNTEYEEQGKSLFVIHIVPFGKCPGVKNHKAGVFYKESSCVELPKTVASHSLLFGLGERVYSLQETTIGAPANMTVLMEYLEFN